MTTDWITCKRDTPIYRLGCQLSSEVVVVEIVIDDVFTSHNFQSISIRNIFEINDASKMSLQALLPQLKVQIDWSSQCWPDDPDIYNGSIFIHVNGIETEESLRVGDNLYLCAVPAWSTEDAASGKFKIKTTFSLKDKSSSPIVPPTRGLSPECKMLVKNLRLDFNPATIQASLKDLEGRAEDQSKIMTLSSIIHADFVDDKNIAICQLIKLADRLRTIQGVSASNMLGLSAKRLIADFVEQASLKKFVDKPTDKNAFDFFVENEQSLNIQVGGLTCSNVTASSFLPSKEPFLKDGVVTNSEGFRNVEIYEEARKKLRELLNYAWAMLAVSEVSIRAVEDVKWIANLSVVADVTA
jgi:hypothetical protein